MDNTVSICDASFGYGQAEDGQGQAQQALRKVSLDVPQGIFMAVIGHNGSGKSTLAKHINALLLPDTGKVLVCGMCTADEALVWEIRKRAGMVFQNPDNQIVATIVEEDVAFGVENLGVQRDEIRTRVDAALASVHMQEYAEHATHMLSGGQKQRIAIAGILAMHPDIIIMDEPTAMLDPVGRQEVIGTALRLNREEGITVLLITHFMEEAILADRVAVMNEGRIVMQGTPKEVFQQVDELKAIGLDVPPMTELAHLLRSEGVAVSVDVIEVEEMVEALWPLLQKN